MGSTLGINAGRTAGKDDSFRLFLENFVEGCVERQDFAVDLAFADPAGDQLAVLGAKIKDDDRVVVQERLQRKSMVDSRRFTAKDLRLKQKLTTADCGPP